MSKSIDFYKNVFPQKTYVFTDNRWAYFTCGQTLALFNVHYDKEVLENNEHVDEKFNKEYQLNYYIADKIMMNNHVLFNYHCDDLKGEYDR